MLCIRTGAKHAFGTVRHRTPPQDVVAPNKDARIALLPTWRVGYAALRMQPDNGQPTTDRAGDRPSRPSGSSHDASALGFSTGPGKPPTPAARRSPRGKPRE